MLCQDATLLAYFSYFKKLIRTYVTALLSVCVCPLILLGLKG
jgi:hypothetical protein